MSEILRSRSGKIPAAVKYSGISRSVIYKLAPQYPRLLKKNGKATIVDFDVLDTIIDELPPAQLKTESKAP